MFNNVGRKIKTLAVTFFVIGVIFIGIGFIGALASAAELGGVIGLSMMILSLVVFAIGFFFMWMGAIYIYAYGELIENTQKIADNTNNIVLMLEEQFYPQQNNFQNNNTGFYNSNDFTYQPPFQTTPVAEQTVSKTVCINCGAIIGDKKFCPVCGTARNATSSDY